MERRYKTSDGKDILVREATEKDLQEIVCIWNAMVDEKDYTMGRDKFTLEDEKKYFAEMDKREGFLVAVVNGKIVGYTQVNIHYRQSISTSHVASVGTWVVKEFRSAGVGGALLDATLNLARRKGFEKACAHVRASNTGALGFYKKAGFYEVGRYKKHIKIDGAYDDWVVLERFLNENKNA